MSFADDLARAKSERTPRMALRPDHRFPDEMDDIVVKDVTMFRAEAMDLIENQGDPMSGGASVVSECCDARVAMQEGDYVTDADVIVTIHEPDGTTKLVQPRLAWWVCGACGEKCEVVDG